ncbi:hypothetical protein COW95_03220 [Candidatus Peregrinibacteria bacterium CG22_combo_CG10-13_8_21_14_all_49_11]|nr:MAG: hypothetical protein COW95_03220 [Candidatus Peregrinibacteria bacterium CG22_combo_CG10-13_8_21_14_all_49_11]
MYRLHKYLCRSSITFAVIILAACELTIEPQPPPPPPQECTVPEADSELTLEEYLEILPELITDPSFLTEATQLVLRTPFNIGLPAAAGQNCQWFTEDIGGVSRQVRWCRCIRRAVRGVDVLEFCFPVHPLWKCVDTGTTVELVPGDLPASFPGQGALTMTPIPRPVLTPPFLGLTVIPKNPSLIPLVELISNALNYRVFLLITPERLVELLNPIP